MAALFWMVEAMVLANASDWGGESDGRALRIQGSKRTGKNPLVAEQKKAKGTVKDEKLVEYVDKILPIIEGHLAEAKKLEAKMGE